MLTDRQPTLDTVFSAAYSSYTREEKKKRKQMRRQGIISQMEQRELK